MKCHGPVLLRAMSGYPHSTASQLPASATRSQRRASGLWSHSAIAVVSTAVMNRPGCCACKSRTAAVSITTSPGD